jgi:hypothetical protein
MLSPELYPINIDSRRHLISFVRMFPQQYRDMSFLDPGATAREERTYTYNLDDLLLYGLHVSKNAAPVHYVFHTAYCCSTLLSRYLDLIPPCFVLREPGLLGQIAMLRPSRNPGSNSALSVTAAEWQGLLNLSVRLLTRTYTGADIVVIKVNDLCNSLGDSLLEANAHSKIVFLYVSLEIFILSVLKRQARRVWLRRRLRDTRTSAESFPELANIDPGTLRDAEGAAYLWLLNNAIYNALRAGNHAARVIALDGDGVAENPEVVLTKVAAFLGLTLHGPKLTQLLAHPYVRRYSKDLSLEYDTISRRQTLADTQAQFGMEAERGVQWASGIKHTLEFESAT